MRRLRSLVALAIGCTAMGCLALGCGTSSVDGADLGASESFDLAGADLTGAPAPDDLAAADLLPPPPPFVYISGYTTTIARYRLDPDTGALTSLGTTTATGSPSFLAVDPARAHLYAVDEANSKVEAFAIDATSGALTHLAVDPSSGGSGPAHVTVDATGKWVLVANYGSGDVGVLGIKPDGSLNAPTMLNAGANAHEVVLDATNQFAFVPCLGAAANYIKQYKLNAATGALSANTPAQIPAAAAGVGPRHLAIHPNGKLAYLIEETASKIATYTLDGGGHLGQPALQEQTLRAAGATGNNTGAEVQVRPDGKFVYGSNRGDDDIAVFSVGADGKLTPVAHTKTGGQTPRHFSIDPTGRWLLVANQGSGDVRVFAINAATGLLTTAGNPVTFTMPSFVGVVARP